MNDRLIIPPLRLFLRLLGIVKGKKYRHSQEYEDNFLYMDTGEKLWWAYKAMVKQIERAEEGKGIEEYFRSQDLSFPLPDNFQPERSIRISAGGDLNCSEIITPESTEQLWDDVADFFFDADLVCANLESPLDPSKPYSGVPEACLTAPALNTTPELFHRYARGGKGINVFSTANNHSLDMGEEGLVATLDFLDAEGYPHVGTARTPEEQADIPVIERSGIRVAFLAYTYCMNGHEAIPGKEYMTNSLRLNLPDTDISLIREHVRIAKEKGADLVVAMLHWSVEFETYPIENVITMGHRVAECGVDVILGGHPHVAQPLEKYRFTDPFSGREKDSLVLYSFGELVSYNAFSRNSRLALLLKLDITKGTKNGQSATYLSGVKVFPVYTWVRRFPDGSADYRLLDLRKVMSSLDTGSNPWGFSGRQIRELRRLERLFYQRLLPEKTEGLLVTAEETEAARKIEAE